MAKLTSKMVVTFYIHMNNNGNSCCSSFPPVFGFVGILD
jgi:hypothetical protein